MSDLRIQDSDRELVFENGDLVLTQGREGISQHLAQRLRTFFGEWFLDTRIGVPYYEHILLKSPNPEVLDTIFKSVILNTPGVQELLDFDITFPDDDNPGNRTMTLEFKANTIAGVIDFTEVLGVF